MVADVNVPWVKPELFQVASEALEKKEYFSVIENLSAFMALNEDRLKENEDKEKELFVAIEKSKKAILDSRKIEYVFVPVSGEQRKHFDAQGHTIDWKEPSLTYIITKETTFNGAGISQDPGLILRMESQGNVVTFPLLPTYQEGGRFEAYPLLQPWIEKQVLLESKTKLAEEMLHKQWHDVGGIELHSDKFQAFDQEQLKQALESVQ